MTETRIIELFKTKMQKLQFPGSAALFELQKINSEFQNYTRQINATWHFQKIEVFSPDLRGFLEVVSQELHRQVRAHALFTPANSTGFPPHYDFEDTLLYQTEGLKHWKKWKPFRDHINPEVLAIDQKNESILEWAKISPATEFLMKPGDFYLMPAGHPHRTWTSELASMHYSFSIA